MTNILTFDTSNNFASVAIYNAKDKVSFYKISVEKSMQAKLILSYIEEGLNKCELNFNNIDIIATSAGPGSFTGVRISATVIKAMALSLNNSQFFMIPSLYAIASSYLLNNIIVNIKNIVVIIDVSSEELYYQNINLVNNKLMLDYNIPPKLIKLEDALIHTTNSSSDNLILGSGLKKLNSKIINSELSSELTAQHILDSSLYILENKIEAKIVDPIYVRPSV